MAISPSLAFTELKLVHMSYKKKYLQSECLVSIKVTYRVFMHTTFSSARMHLHGAWPCSVAKELAYLNLNMNSVTDELCVTLNKFLELFVIPFLYLQNKGNNTTT